MDVASVDARIEQVTVYASGARVRRVVTIPAPLPARVRITGLPLAVVDDSVRVEVGGPAVATSVRVGVEAPPTGEAAPEERDDVRSARRRQALAEAALERLLGALELVSAASVIEPDPGDEGRPAWAAVIAARRALIGLAAERALDLNGQLAAARREVDDARRAFVAVVDRDQRLGTSRAAKLHELRKHVELELAVSASSEIVVHVEYQIAAARWAPSYVARLDGDRVGLEVRAVVAQDAGEDWTRVPLTLSTAEPERFAVLPELAAQRIGRRQQEPARAGFRPPPTGAGALYADYERDLSPRRREAPTPIQGRSQIEDSTYEGARPSAPPPPLAYGAPSPETAAGFAGEVWDEESSHAKEAFSTPPSGMPMPQGLSVEAMNKRAPTRSGGGGRRSSRPEPAGELAPPPPAPSVPRLDYGNLVMAPPASPSRGTLAPVHAHRYVGVIASELEAAQARLAALPLPPGHAAAWAHTYDYAFVTDGAVDVRADGAWHAIAVTAKPSAAKLRHVAVPRAQPDVFRVASIANPLAGPLLPGPIDVYDRGRFLLTSSVDYTPPGATVEVGLGVDAGVKLARNTEYHEEAAGMLRGALRLVHAITIEVDNLSGRAIDLEVRERIPIKRDGDDEVEITLGRIEPAWERWLPEPGAPRDQRLRGGHRWRLAVPAGAKRTLRAGYEVRIAGKLELVGGNRREP